jgi:hypothetical protein
MNAEATEITNASWGAEILLYSCLATLRNWVLFLIWSGDDVNSRVHVPSEVGYLQFSSIREVSARVI